MREITIWHTPQIVLTETQDELLGYSYQLTYPLIRNYSRATIKSTLEQLKTRKFMYLPIHYFAEDEGAVTHYELAYYEEDEDGVERVVDGYATAYHMYMVTCVNQEPEAFAAMSLLRQLEECTRSLEYIRPGIADQILKDVEDIYWEGSPDPVKGKRRSKGKSRKKRRKIKRDPVYDPLP